jgi:DNA polymerase elongation subunit (family B)
MKKSFVSFDIETEGLERDLVLSFAKPFKTFDASKIKIGDCKTEEARACKIACAKAAHDAEERAYLDEQASRGALHPETGRVLSIGFWEGGKPTLLLPHTVDPNGNLDPEEVERRMLAAFWMRWQGLLDDRGQLISWNGAGFDLPFLQKRSWILRVPYPRWVRSRGRHWHDSHVDLMQLWGNYDPHAYIKLDHAARALRIGGKAEQEVSGGSFAPYYREGGERRDLAIRYAIKDIELTARLAEIMLNL